MSIKVVPDWMINLEDEDVEFIKKFVLSSGSLKEMAKEIKIKNYQNRMKIY